MIGRLNNPEKAEPLFREWNEAIIWSCVQGIMGGVYTHHGGTLRSAMAELGDFCFFAGVPDRELVMYKPENRFGSCVIMVPQDEGWEAMISDCYKDRAKRITRYATKKEPKVFDVKMLRDAAASLEHEYTFKMMDEGLYGVCRSYDWSHDLVSQFTDYKMYQNLGLGVVALKEGSLVCGASSYARYRDGIEIEIDTRKDCRRKGLAYACGARLILECLERGLYPSWDAQNLWSAQLAEKLGYHRSHAYTAFEVRV